MFGADFERAYETHHRPYQSGAEQRMFAKLNSSGFLIDLRPLLAADQAANLTQTSVKQAFTKIFSSLIVLIPGERWARTDDMARRFGVSI